MQYEIIVKDLAYGYKEFRVARDGINGLRRRTTTYNLINHRECVQSSMSIYACTQVVSFRCRTNKCDLDETKRKGIR